MGNGYELLTEFDTMQAIKRAKQQHERAKEARRVAAECRRRAAALRERSAQAAAAKRHEHRRPDMEHAWLRALLGAIRGGRSTHEEAALLDSSTIG
jgi:hypothetical protein